MTKIEIAWLFQKTADYLELAQIPRHEVMMYRKAAQEIRSVKKLSTWIEKLPSQLDKDIEEIKRIGISNRLLHLEKTIPSQYQEMLQIPGFTPGLLLQIQNVIGEFDMEALREKAKERLIRKIPGFGSKTELMIIRGIDLYVYPSYTYPLGMAVELAKDIMQDIYEIPGVEKLLIAGAARRGRDLVEDIQILVRTTDVERFQKIVTKHPRFTRIVNQDEFGLTMMTPIHLPLTFIYSKKNLFIDLHEATGSDAYLAAFHRWKKDPHVESVVSEEEIYEHLSIPYIYPELRESEEALSLAYQNFLPEILHEEDIRGDLHVHTNWSDGVDSLHEMVEGAEAKGYEYLAITDHSRSLVVANGLSIERLEEQHQKIDALQVGKAIRLIKGVEVDILEDGSLDYPDEVLEKAELVIASVHRHTKQDRETITQRVEKALKNPHVDFFAHPTGRMLGFRKGTAIDLEPIFELAQKTGIALEINASADRLDLDAENIKRSQAYGIPITINTDAHSVGSLDDMALGVKTARRGMLEKEQIINTWPIKKLQKWLKRKKPLNN